jgi:hypothetical protein
MQVIGWHQNEKTVVARLSVRGSGLDPIPTQSRLASLLNNTDARPTGLSPAAIVVVRRLRDPLPGSLDLRQHNLEPPPAWQQALRARLDSLAAGAARPALAAVPANAEAVVFLDRSELLACLASDWCEPRVATQWWWQSLLRQADAEQVVWKAWRSSPEYVPAALQHLARWGKAVDFIRVLGDARAYELMRALARSFELNRLIPALEYAPGSERPRFQTNEDRDLRSPTRLAQPEAKEDSVAGQSLAPWRSGAPESLADGLGVGQQLLLGIGLSLERAPEKVRASAFAREVDRWYREVANPPAIGFVSAQRGNDEDRAQRSAAPRQSSEVGGDDHPADNSPFSINEKRAARHRVSLGQDPATTPYARAFPPRRPNDDFPADTVPSQIEKGFAASLPETSDELTEADSRLVQNSGAGHQELDIARNPGPTAVEAASADQLLIEAPTETQFGGVFYLINLALYLGLYGDFTTPAEPGIELDIWDFVALVGRELVGEQFESDPLWTLLARLAGHKDEGPGGNDFRPGDEWRMPPVWLEPFSEGSFKHATVCGRLLVFHSDGFLVIDVPLETTDAEPQLQLELTAYEDLHFPVTTLTSEDLFPEKDFTRRRSDVNASFEIDVWLSRLIPYVRARLQKALGLADSADPSAVLCRLSARVCVTPTHVDVFFALSELPIEVRRAGLDRDPGWIPVAGRFVEFHFD